MKSRVLCGVVRPRQSLVLVLGSLLFFVGCNQQSKRQSATPAGGATQSSANSNETKTAAAAAMTSDEQAANELYLADAVESYGEVIVVGVDGNIEATIPGEAADTSVVTSEASTPSTPAADAEVKADMKGRRLEQMANMIFDKLDKDDSNGLSLEEFLAGPENMPQFGSRQPPKMNDAMKAKVVAKLTEEFNAAAGDDKVLSVDELISLLSKQAPRIGTFRAKHHPGKQEARVKESWEEILTKYDKDGDKLLNQSEFEAVMSARQQDEVRWKKRDAKFGNRASGDRRY